ncbi:MAG: tyrosine-type recombinase/integrase [Candidatus Dormibacteraceae bacterium]
MAKGRRGGGEGSITHRQDGRWEARLDLGWVGGKRRRKVVYAETRSEVANKLHDLIQERRRLGRLPTETIPTLANFMEGWLTSVKGSLRPQTYAGYERYSRQHIIPSLGRIRLDRLTPEQVQEMLDDKLKAGLAPRSIVQIRAILRRALNRAIRSGRLFRNVASLTDPPRIEQHEAHVLTPEEMNRFLVVAAKEELGTLYILALFTGLRQGELLGLNWSDINLEEGQLRVARALQKVEGKLKLLPTKTAKSRRVVSLPKAAIVALRLLEDKREEVRALAGRRWHESELVFTTRWGTPLNARNVVRSFKRFLTRLNLPDMRFHDLRHSCATLLLVQGVAPRVVMEILGHSTINVTMNTYSHVLPSLQQAAAARLDELVQAANEDA